MSDAEVSWFDGGADPDAIVIGGGVVGICVGLYLQRTGRKVRVIERDVPGASASGHNGGVLAVNECVPVGTPGIVRSVPGMLVDPLSPLAIRWRYLPRLAPWLSRFLWASRPARVEAIARTLFSLTSLAVDAYQPLISGTEAAELIKPTGVLEVFRSDKAFDAAQANLRLRTRLGSSFEILEGDAIGDVDPALRGRFRHAVFYPQWHHTVHPGTLTLTLARQFTQHGGQLQQAAVHGFRRERGVVTAVATSAGDVRANDFVIAAGAWSRHLLRQLGTSVPLDTERGYGVDYPDPGLSLKMPVICADHHYGLTPLGSGLRLVGTSELAGLLAPPNYARSERTARAAKSAFPELRSRAGRPWMAFRPSMPDSLPVIGRAPRHDNVYLAFGHGHKGLGQGAITGRLISELIEGKSTAIDVEPLRPTRFARSHGLRNRRTEAA